MLDLTTNYLGFKLKNPIIVGSSGLTNSVEKIKKLEEHGVGAVVLKSLFEEQILMEMDNNANQNYHDYPEAHDYARYYTKEKNTDDYLQLIKDAKQAVNIPIIASINCVSDKEWIGFAKSIEDAGADALELNIALLPSDFKQGSSENEQKYFDVITKIRGNIKIPIALKISHYSAGLAQLVEKLSWTKKIDAFVLFNRFYNPDIDIENKKIISSSVTSSPNDIFVTLRWIALLSDKIKEPLVASTGIHDGAGVIKQLLAGAQAVQMVSSIYNEGSKHIETVIKDIKDWMNKNNYTSINDFRGLLNQKNVENPAFYERTQFMKYFSSYKDSI
ncbi:MAG: dihydroorotate dehydrogenase-like protein [Bacteroidetes bacterium]|nr:dihydroorotate dehydrogenase-like protein [Bacteroidota bacterium]